MAYIGNRRYKFWTVFFEVSSFVGNPVAVLPVSSILLSVNSLNLMKNLETFPHNSSSSKYIDILIFIKFDANFWIRNI